ncbi:MULTISPECIES: hypothetical protein [Micromonospora]|uniref:LPXTG-motif cell wall anchor domain-containing protein n=1 Tax=Micromonospora yangpuensis TaxID=683228 RepID=A0A1C6URE5_9ACTN|nr:hypothetical protein [Micromonospora yangpuensis]GGM07426.1 hypothetical protein GCM10012279_26790 [Micromonospora yangpuensis]SCL56379.1 hypothetical protein GA0070617_3223 [Micromonospora yangpuensis]
MRLTRIIMALTVGLAVVAAPAVAAAAAPQPTPSQSVSPTDYPPQPPALTVTPTTTTVGNTVTLTGAGFLPGETVVISVTVNPVLPSITVVADANGRFSVPYTPTIEGTYTFTAVGQTSGRTASTTLRVLPRPQPSPSHTWPPHHGGKPPHKGGWLPVTGDNVGTPVKVGGGLVGAGAVLMLLTLAWRRRSRFGSAGD